MIEKLLLDYLNTMPGGITAYMEVPEDPEEKYIVIQKTGSSRKNMIDHAMVAFQSYADTLEDAAELNEAVKAWIDAAPDSIEVYTARLNSDYNFTNTQTRKYRYQAVYDIYY